MRGLAALVLTIALVVSGCGSDDDPKPAPNPTKSPSPSETTPTPPEMPEAAREKTRAGAIAFARGFIRALNYAGATGDSQPLRALYVELCTRCEAMADSIDQTYEDGGFYRGGAWTPTRFEFHTIDNDVAVLDAYVSYAPQVWVKKKGGRETRFPASKNNLKAFNLRWSGDGWTVSALDPTA